MSDAPIVTVDTQANAMLAVLAIGQATDAGDLPGIGPPGLIYKVECPPKPSQHHIQVEGKANILLSVVFSPKNCGVTISRDMLGRMTDEGEHVSWAFSDFSVMIEAINEAHRVAKEGAPCTPEGS